MTNLYESTQSKEHRRSNGVHYTSVSDIMKIVGPCILEAWEEGTDLQTYTVLDPACGTGNFLDVAYEELSKKGDYPKANLIGIELDPEAAKIAAAKGYTILQGDALAMKWPDASVIIGNPPYIGCKQILGAKGDEYIKWLRSRFKGHNRMADYCTYWFAKILEDARPGIRVGLVCTKTISETNSREASLDKILEAGGTIFNAISRQKWTGEAAVIVSIVNFVNRGPHQGEKYLDGKKVSVISSRLKDFEILEPKKLASNLGIAFVGLMPNGMGFLLDEATAKGLIRANPENRKVIKRYLTGEDLVQNPDQSPSRWIIDFQTWTLEEASKFKEPFRIVREKVKPVRDLNRRKKYREKWWRFGEEAPELRSKTQNLTRFICTSRVSKFPIFVFVENKNILPSDRTVSIAFDNYGHLGVMSSKFHTDWYIHQCSTFGQGLRYTNTTVFETFPFPESISTAVASIMEELDTYRKSQNMGLTELYNLNPPELQRLHNELNKEVAKCYKFPVSDIEDTEKILKFLLKKNLANP